MKEHNPGYEQLAKLYPGKIMVMFFQIGRIITMGMMSIYRMIAKENGTTVEKEKREM